MNTTQEKVDILIAIGGTQTNAKKAVDVLCAYRQRNSTVKPMGSMESMESEPTEVVPMTPSPSVDDDLFESSSPCSNSDWFNGDDNDVNSYSQCSLPSFPPTPNNDSGDQNSDGDRSDPESSSDQHTCTHQGDPFNGHGESDDNHCLMISGLLESVVNKRKGNKARYDEQLVYDMLGAIENDRDTNNMVEDFKAWRGAHEMVVNALTLVMGAWSKLNITLRMLVFTYVVVTFFGDPPKNPKNRKRVRKDGNKTSDDTPQKNRKRVRKDGNKTSDDAPQKNRKKIFETITSDMDARLTNLLEQMNQQCDTINKLKTFFSMIPSTN